MRGFTFSLLLISLCVPLWAAPTVSASGDVWTLDNAAIKVDIDAQAGTFQVLDKTSGYLWKGPDGPAEAEVKLAVPQAKSAVSIDGNLSDWANQGVTIPVTTDMVADARKIDGPADLSAQLHLAWKQDALLVGLEVKDEKLVSPAGDEAEWWYKDSIEFWIGAEQYAVRFGDWGANFWHRSGAVAGAKAAFKPAPGGYALELSVPAALLGDAGKVSAGAKLRFALGINDCDGDDGRQGQLYYPATWAHSNPASFAAVTLTDAAGNAPPAPPQADAKLVPVSGLRAQAGQTSFKTTANSDGRTFPVTLTFALDGDSPDLLITVAADDPDVSPGRFTVLHPLVLDRPEGRILCASYCNGIGVPTDDMSWRGRQWVTWGIDMPWVGLTDGNVGYMLLWELPVSCDNGAAVLERVKTGDQVLLAPGAYHHPIKGKFADPRIVRYSFFPAGGHVAICKRYREYARVNGFLRTQKEKMVTKPHLARLAGAPDIWGRSDLRFCQEAKAAGMDRLLLNSPQSWDDMEKIKGMGYLMGVYDNYEDAYEGDTGRYGDFVEADDVVINADGARMKAWLTKSDPPKQFMKRCSAVHERVSRTWTPKELEKYPYNARFIDVTTATGLRECFHPNHALTRTEDRMVKRGLAEYMGDELNLVLGGEHGRWWGADIFNYWEGMQSGGFYSWPAGYVGQDLPEKREDIGKQYLEWGLGETNRYPLWELCFHDCVVSTWYWGDSTGHLLATAPELGYKQDAFNILYGTVPLYWVSQPYSYNWGKPELRERLLESYRNTCKLHEVVGFEELESHEFVTENRAVQKSVFGDGTQVWVNFGETAWALERDGKTYTLPQFGFYVKGPKIEQFRATATDGKLMTYIRTDDYLYAKGDVPGLIETAGAPDASHTVRRDGSALRVVSDQTSGTVRLNVARMLPECGVGNWLAAPLDEQGTTESIVSLGTPEGGFLTWQPADQRINSVRLTLLSPAAMAEKAELALRFMTPPAVGTPLAGRTTQGGSIRLQFEAANLGGMAARDVRLALYRGLVSEDTLLDEAKLDVPERGTRTCAFDFDTSRYDGEADLVAVLDDGNAVAEFCETDNRATLKYYIEPDWKLWEGHFDVTGRVSDAFNWKPIFRMPMDLQAEWAKLGLEGEADRDAVRVVRLGAKGEHIPFECQLASGDAGPELIWQSASMREASSEKFRVYLDGAAQKRHASAAPGHWNAQTSTYEGPNYSVKFEEGYIRGIAIDGTKIIGNLGASSGDTGWVDEVGDVESFEVVQDGPILTQVRTKKKLRGDHYYDKLYDFYPNYFTVTTLSEERFGVPSRAYHLVECTYQDDKGNKATVDGKGDAEDVSGKNGGPKWYSTWTDDWALSCVAITPHDGVTYWDGGSWGGVGLNTSRKAPATVAYVVHRRYADEDALDGPALAARDYAQLHAPTIVER